MRKRSLKPIQLVYTFQWKERSKNDVIARQSEPSSFLRNLIEMALDISFVNENILNVQGSYKTPDC